MPPRDIIISILGETLQVSDDPLKVTDGEPVFWRCDGSVEGPWVVGLKTLTSPFLSGRLVFTGYGSKHDGGPVIKKPGADRIIDYGIAARSKASGRLLIRDPKIVIQDGGRDLVLEDAIRTLLVELSVTAGRIAEAMNELSATAALLTEQLDKRVGGAGNGDGGGPGS